MTTTNNSIAVANDAVAALMQQFQSGANFNSTNGLVCTAKQTKQVGKYFKGYQKAKNKAANLAIVADLTFAFDPFLGVETQQYNAIKEFRSQGSARTMMAFLKQVFGKEPEKYVNGIDRLKRESGVKDWNPAENPEELTAKDFEVFKHYLKPKTFTLPVCSVNIPAITGLKWGKEYLVDVDRDPETDEIIGEIPVILQLGQLQTDFYGRKYRNWEEDRKQKVAAGVAKELTDEEKKEKMKEIFSHITVSNDAPSNRTLAVELPLNSTQDIEYSELLSKTPQELFGNFVLLRQNKKVKEELANFGKPARSKYISPNGFFHLKVESGNEDDPAKLGQATTYGTPTDNSFVFPTTPEEKENSKILIDKICGILDENAKDLEKIFLKSVKIRAFDDELNGKLIKAVEASIDWDDSSIVDETFVIRHSNIMSLMSSKKVTDLLDQYGLSVIEVKPSDVLTKEEADIATAVAVDYHDPDSDASNPIANDKSLEDSINEQAELENDGDIQTTFE